jgi:hypothetical protein
MVDGFGSAIRYGIRDSAAVENWIARTAAIRNGADNTGQYCVQVANAGSLATKMCIDHNGEGYWSGKLRVGDATAPTYGLEVVNVLKTESGRIVKTTRLINTDSPYTVLSSDYEIFCDTDAGAITVNLPAGVDGTKYRITNTGSSGNDVTVAPNGAELLTGTNASRTLSDRSVIILTYETTEGWW